jgi:glutathione S-transferase
MDLYFSPLACSMATRIALYEAGQTATYLEVDPKAKIVLSDGSDFRKVNPLGLVPTLRTDDGVVLTENAAILQYVADRFPQAGIGAAPSGLERSRLHQWLCFIGTELHKGLFVPLLDKKAGPEVKSWVLEKNLSRLDFLETYLKGRDYLLDHFSVADAYLVTVINWTMATPPVELAKWPALKAYYDRLRARPSIAKAIAEELELYKAEIARHKAAA